MYKRQVLASFGKEAGYGPTLASALDNVLGVTDGDDSFVDPTDPAEPGTPDPDTGGNGGSQPGTLGDVESLLEQAEDKFTEAEAALQDGDLQGYADAQEEARDLVAQALEAAGAQAPSSEGSPDGRQ